MHTPKNINSISKPSSTSKIETWYIIKHVIYHVSHFNTSLLTHVFLKIKLSSLIVDCEHAMCFCSCGLFVPFWVIIDTKIVNRSLLSIGVTSCPYILCFVCYRNCVLEKIQCFALCRRKP